MTRGAIYIAYGEAARREARMSLMTLKAQLPALPVAIVGESSLDGARFVPLTRVDAGGRHAKVHLDAVTPFDETLYIDADTRVRGDLSVGFDMLRDGWDMVIAPSEAQGKSAFWHVGETERETTLDEIGFTPVQLQAGVMFFRQTDAVRALFGAWREEWTRWGGQDQAALARALYRIPARVWVVGRPYNGGALIAHLFGKVMQ